jgi:hypothetical protein
MNQLSRISRGAMVLSASAQADPLAQKAAGEMLI